jgi:hypothetical protein
METEREEVAPDKNGYTLRKCTHFSCFADNLPEKPAFRNALFSREIESQRGLVVRHC